MIRSSIRAKLSVGFTAAIVVQAAITCLVGVRLFHDRMLGQAQREVTAALNSAREIYLSQLREVKDTVRLSATRSRITDAVDKGDRETLARELDQIRRREGLDILTAADAQGRVICRAQNPDHFGDDRSSDPLVRAVLAKSGPVWGTLIVPRAELLQENAVLADQAFIRFVDTPRAKWRPETCETAGMVLAAAAPVFDRDNRLRGILYGGVLLNRDYMIVDKIRTVVFEEKRYKGREVATATIFQGDLRISTNVENRDGTRAIGTRVSSVVYEAVLERGERWIDEAFVVNDMYITAYEPIRDLQGQIIGILYVGILKRPFMDELWRTLAIFIGIALLGITLVILISVLVAETLTRPLRDMVRLAKKVSEGDYDVEIKVESNDEIGRLADAFNAMTTRLAEVLGELQTWARTLEQKVEERSREIRAMQEQLMQSEKLASLGKLAAGVAHEINNPMTGILTNASLLLEDLPPDAPQRADLQTIVDETIRCRRIVKGLLDFARQTRPEMKKVSLNEIMRNSLSLLRNQASFRNIELIEEYDPYLSEIVADPNQMQQVFVNMLINASEAMPEGGRIRVGSRRAGRAGKHVEAFVADSGPGIPPEAMTKLFDPFFTTKRTGTGLGLAVSYGIIQSHGGTIDVDSTPGHGATFTVRLPVAEP